MKRVAWGIGLIVLVIEIATAANQYQHAKPWMRSGYVWLFAAANRITGNDLNPPDRFK